MKLFNIFFCWREFKLNFQQTDIYLHLYSYEFCVICFLYLALWCSFSFISFISNRQKSAFIEFRVLCNCNCQSQRVRTLKLCGLYICEASVSLHYNSCDSCACCRLVLKLPLKNAQDRILQRRSRTFLNYCLSKLTRITDLYCRIYNYVPSTRSTIQCLPSTSPPLAITIVKLPRLCVATALFTVVLDISCHNSALQKLCCCKLPFKSLT